MIPIAELKTCVEAFYSAVKAGFPPAGGNQMSAVADGAARVGLDRNAYRQRLSIARAIGYMLPDAIRMPPNAARLREQYGVDVQTTGVRAQPAEVPLKTAKSAAPIDDVEERRGRDETALLRRRIKALEERAITAEAWQDRFRVMRDAKLEPVDWLAAPHVRKPNSLVPMLFTSDFQCGEVIRPEEIDGMNAYNCDIFASRYQTMIDKTISLATGATGGTDFPYAIYLRGGDAISGEIHEELAQTNDLSAIPALRLLQRQEREGILRLKAAFGKVRVISIPGNHGRTTFKSHAKGYTERSFETLLAWWLAERFEDDPDVTFYTPPSGDAQFDVLNWSFLMAHGDRMGSRGGQGFVGPAATISRGHQKLYQSWSATGRPVHCILTGHLHTSLKLLRGYANGSLAGYSEYARDLQALPDAAKQWLFFIHQEQMISHAFELKLSEQPRRTMRMEPDA